MAYFDITGRRIPTHMSDPAVVNMLKYIDGKMGQQNAILERIAKALEALAAAQAPAQPTLDRTVMNEMLAESEAKDAKTAGS